MSGGLITNIDTECDIRTQVKLHEDAMLFQYVTGGQCKMTSLLELSLIHISEPTRPY